MMRILPYKAQFSDVTQYAYICNVFFFEFRRSPDTIGRTKPLKGYSTTTKLIRTRSRHVKAE